MGSLNIEIPESTHNEIRMTSKKLGVPMKMLVIETFRGEFGVNRQFSTFVERVESVARIESGRISLRN